jgi:hypothetical protein
MCRNIRVLHHFEPPTSSEEIRAAAEQYVRKVSGLRAPTKGDEAEFVRAIEAVTKATNRLLEKLPERGEPRTREGERAKARHRWESRETRMHEKFAATTAATGRTPRAPTRARATTKATAPSARASGTAKERPPR